MFKNLTTFRKLLKRAQQFASRDKYRPVLQCVQVRGTELCATDGHRLALIAVPDECLVADAARMSLLPEHALLLVDAAIEAGADTLVLEDGVWKAGPFSLALPGNTFPDVARYLTMPAQPWGEATVTARDIAAAVAAVEPAPWSAADRLLAACANKRLPKLGLCRAPLAGSEPMLVLHPDHAPAVESWVNDRAPTEDDAFACDQAHSKAGHDGPALNLHYVKQAIGKGSAVVTLPQSSGDTRDGPTWTDPIWLVTEGERHIIMPMRR